jgi:glutathione peroxidase-family protein
MSSFTDLRARTNAGEEIRFDSFAGKVVLAVNVARL